MAREIAVSNKALASRETPVQLGTRGRYAVMAMTDLAAGGEPAARCLWARSPRASRSRVRISSSCSPICAGADWCARCGDALAAISLARPASEVSVADVVAAVDEGLKATRCAGHGPGCLAGGARCRTHDLWAQTGRRIESYLAAVSLADVVAGRLDGQPGTSRARAA